MFHRLCCLLWPGFANALFVLRGHRSKTAITSKKKTKLTLCNIKKLNTRRHAGLHPLPPRHPRRRGHAGRRAHGSRKPVKGVLFEIKGLSLRVVERATTSRAWPAGRDTQALRGGKKKVRGGAAIPQHAVPPTCSDLHRVVHASARGAQRRLTCMPTWCCGWRAA